MLYEKFSEFVSNNWGNPFKIFGDMETFFESPEVKIFGYGLIEDILDAERFHIVFPEGEIAIILVMVKEVPFSAVCLKEDETLGACANSLFASKLQTLLHQKLADN